MGEPQLILFLNSSQRKVFQSNQDNKSLPKIDFMKHPTSKASLCFIAFIANEFEDYLIQMQSNDSYNV